MAHWWGYDMRHMLGLDMWRTRSWGYDKEHPILMLQHLNTFVHVRLHVWACGWVWANMLTCEREIVHVQCGHVGGCG